MYSSLCIVLALFAVSEATFNADGPDNLRYSATQCKEQSGATDELITELFSHKLNPEITDLKGHCFVACWLEHIGALKPDGTVNSSLLLKNLAKDIENVDEVTEELRKCADQPGEGCEKKFKIALCIERVEDLVRFRTSG